MTSPPLRNRVTPFGEIVATRHRGSLMGNRGCLHDEQRRIVRLSANEAWIACMTDWLNIRRTIMEPGHYTELFFLDEATALAAGHRPCGSCRPDRLHSFKRAWARANGLAYLPRVAQIDRELRQSLPLAVRSRIDADAFPDGGMATVPGGGEAWLRWQGAWHRWSFAGYDSAPTALPAQLVPITPPAMLAVLSEGYLPMVAVA